MSRASGKLPVAVSKSSDDEQQTIELRVERYERVPIDSLAHFPGNPRRGSLDAIRRSIAAHGQFKPVICRKQKRQVLAGNHVFAAMRDLDAELIDVGWIDVPSDDDAAKIVAADNRAFELGEGSDPEQLLELLRSMGDLEGSLYSDAELAQLEAKSQAPNTSPQLGDAFEYRLLVMCDDAEHQAALLERFEEEGLTVTVLAQ